jgi:gliding motility-associated-like protein
VSTDPPAGNNVRTLVLFHTASNCSDTAAYVREELVNVDGSYGGVGSVNDGATTRFTWPGAPLVTYVNAGCQAPIEPLVVEAEALGVLCGGASVDLVGTVEGNVLTVQWQGGTGTFSDPNALATTYTPGVGENGAVELQLCVTTSCTVPICTTILVPSGDGPVLSVSPEGPLLICGDTPLVITASGADAYSWSTGANGAQVSLTDPGIYVVSGTNACGTDSLSLEVLAGVLPTVSIVGDPTFCPGALTTLTAQGPGPFSWSTGATVASIAVSVAGTYTVSSSTSCGTATAQVTVSSLPAPQVSITGPTQLCVGSSITLTASGSDDYVWSTGATTPSIAVAGPGLISVTGTNVCGTATDDVLITSLSAPQVSITGDATLCPGESAVLTAAGTGPYLWNTGVNVPSITVNSAGTYTVASTNACGTSSAQFVVEQVEVTAVITASAVTGFAPFSVGLGLSSGNADEVSWDLGDGAESTSPTVTHTYTEPGTYTVEVTVMENGCTASDVLIITVLAQGQVPFEEVSSVIIPNVITPNGDGVNERFEPILQRIVRMELHIYNRWGQEVAYLDRPGQVWDARGPSGDPVVDGTYFYVVDAWGGDGVDHRQSGSITVLR